MAGRWQASGRTSRRAPCSRVLPVGLTLHTTQPGTTARWCFPTERDSVWSPAHSVCCTWRIRMIRRSDFPVGFVFGTATSSYQIEGAVDADGRGESIWDRFAATPGAIVGGSDGSVACDHYRRYEQDLDLLEDLGVTAYRFSVAWPRILPEGTGRVEPRGLDFYERLVDGLLERGIEPHVTMYHWDLPQALAEQGGWLNRDTAVAFGDYCAVVAGRLADRPVTYSTL